MVQENSQAPLSVDDLRNSIRSEVTAQFAKWLVGFIVACIGLTITGWWLYLKPKLVEISGGVPAGAVVSFDFPSACPGGWEEFKDGAGRVIVGQGTVNGLTDRKYRAEGGEERHILTIAEMPSHNHSGNVGTSGASFEHHQTNHRMPSEFWQPGTGATGGGLAHENMQPYIVLKLCKKI